MSFICCIDGSYVNLRHVAKITYLQANGKRAATYLLLNANGDRLGEVAAAAFDPEAALAPVVPAAAGTVVVAVYLLSGEGRPTSEDVFIERLPVVGWRIFWDRADPVFVDPPASNAILLSPLADGRWQILGDRSFTSVEDAVSDILAQAQLDWDRLHAAHSVLLPGGALA